MTTRLQTQRFSTTNQRPPTMSRPSGEVWLNFPDLRLGMINPAQAAVDLLAVRNYAPSASYASGDYAVYAGQLQKARTALTPHAYNAADWDPIPTQSYNDATYTTRSQDDQRYVQLAGSTMSGSLILSSDPAQPLQASTKRYTDAQDALKLDLAGGTLSGPLILSGPPTQPNQAATKGYIDTTVGNYLPLTGGVLSGTLRVANGRLLSSGAGNNPSVTVWDQNQGYAAGMFLGGGARLYFGGMDGNGNFASVFGSFGGGGDLSLASTLSVAGDTFVHNTYCDGSVGIQYRAFSPHWFAFGWNGNNINCYVDGGYQFDIASTNWVNSNFATYGWVNGQGFATYSWVQNNFYSGGTSDGRYLYKSGDTSSGNFTVATLSATYDLLCARDMHCGHLFTHNTSNNAWSFWFDGSSRVYIRVDNSADFGPINYISDARAKQDIGPTTLDCIAVINRLALHRFRWRGLNPAEGTFNDAADDAPTVRIGLLAQEVAEVLPEAVPDMVPPPGSKLLLKTIDPMVMLALLTGAVQQLVKEVRQ